MKRIFTAITVFLVAISISTYALAHSHFEESNPVDGDTITEPLNEIVLDFDGQIEQGSFIDVSTAEGETIEVQEIMISESTLTAVLSDPLPNNEYQVSWNIISADGHPLDGEFSFIVDAEVPESVEDESAETEELEEEETVESVETEIIEVEDSTEQLTEDEESSSMTLIVIIALVIIVIIGFIYLTRRKR